MRAFEPKYGLVVRSNGGTGAATMMLILDQGRTTHSGRDWWTAVVLTKGNGFYGAAGSMAEITIPTDTDGWMPCER